MLTVNAAIMLIFNAGQQALVRRKPGWLPAIH